MDDEHSPTHRERERQGARQGHLKVREQLLEGGRPLDLEDAGEALQHLLVCRHDLELGDEGANDALLFLWALSIGTLCLGALGALGALPCAPERAASHDR